MSKTIQSLLILFFVFQIVISCNNIGNYSASINNKPICKQTKISNNQTKAELIPENLKKLQQTYPNFIVEIDSNHITWKDGTKMVYDDGINNKIYETLLNSPDLEDQMAMKYVSGVLDKKPTKNFDPGRIRYEPFFKKMYGSDKKKVTEKLVPVFWLPSSINKKLMVTSVNDINKKLQAISNELDTMPRFHKYLNNPAGTFNWRYISGTNRLSMHSFGVAFDINVNNSNYWKWEKRTASSTLQYKNKIPIEIVSVFEKYGFIWGGKWYHFDTMHFEYRPELL